MFAVLPVASMSGSKPSSAKGGPKAVASGTSAGPVYVPRPQEEMLMRTADEYKTLSRKLAQQVSQLEVGHRKECRYPFSTAVVVLT